MIAKSGCVVVLILASISYAASDQVHNRHLLCKREKTALFYTSPYHEMDEGGLNHVVHRQDKDGLAYFELHVAFKGDVYTTVMLGSEPLRGYGIQVHGTTFHIAFNRSHISIIAPKITEKSLPYNVLSSTLYVDFFVKVDNGTLKVGTDCSTLISYSNSNLRLMKYFTFSGLQEVEGRPTILYDCPAPVCNTAASNIAVRNCLYILVFASILHSSLFSY